MGTMTIPIMSALRLDRESRTIDWYASLELAAKPPIHVDRQQAGVDISTNWKYGPFLFEMPLGKHASMTLDGKNVPSVEQRETIQDWIACKLEDGDHLDCWSMDWNGWNDLYPTGDEIDSMRASIDARENMLVEDKDGTLFKDFTTPHVDEMKKVLAISFNQAKSYLLNLPSIKKDILGDKLVNWIDEIIARRTQLQESNRISFINSYKQFLDTLKNAKEDSNEEMLALIRISKIVKKFLDPTKVLGMLNIRSTGFDGAFQHAIRLELDDDYLAHDAKQIRHNRSMSLDMPIPYDAFQLSFGAVSGMALERGMADAIPDAISHNPIGTAKQGEMRSIVIQRWLDKSPRLRKWNAPSDLWEGYSVSNPRVPRNETFASKDAFVTMFVRDEGWVKERKKMEEHR